MADETKTNPFRAPQASVDDDQNLADTSFTLNLFSAAGRIGRIRYIAYSMGLGLLILLAGTGLTAIFVSPVFAIAAYLAMYYVNIMLTIKRCHDFNTTGWLSLLALIPLANLIFMIIPGTNGTNQFGRKTAPNGGAGVIAILLVVGIAVIGILAAIAIAVPP